MSVVLATVIELERLYDEDGDFHHLFPKGESVSGCGMPRAEELKLGCSKSVWPEQLAAGACRDCGRRYCPQCASVYWSLWR